ncbi:hypothetical protein LWI28_022459 [Acer negundo]|uniref:Uncharacterized protein n=1 Tax=Acer negundo TaxID=4023 RepID=A0AAD5P2T9_ACENE|nr:hypothetical protein LWI28_022459 [Acer negundo]
MVEDYFTGFLLHCKGWNSVLCNPSRPAFLGTATTKLNDTLVQGTRWNCGLLEITLSKVLSSYIWPIKNVCATNHVLWLLCTAAPLFAALMVFSYHASALSLEWHSNISQGFKFMVPDCICFYIFPIETFRGSSHHRRFSPDMVE